MLPRYNSPNMNLSLALARLEKRLQKLVEDSLDGIFTTTDLQKKLGHELLMALQREARPAPDGTILAPDQFTIFLPQDTTRRLAAYHTRLDELSIALAEAIEDFAHQSGYSFADKLTIRILTEDAASRRVSPSTSPAQPAILATFKLHDTTRTASMGVTDRLNGLPGQTQEEETGSRAFLIINGVEIYPLPARQSSGVINIGRMVGNQVVLENGRVSRTHAQLRIMQGRYMLFDLASTYGTFVNGVRINSHELRPGDVISLGGVPVVFGIEEQPAGLSQEESGRPSWSPEDE